jgi:hypothetical protein
LRRPGTVGTVDDPTERALTRLAVEGHLRIAEPSPDPYPSSPLRSRAGTARSLIDAERGER